jgi:hypothetical protein
MSDARCRVAIPRYVSTPCVGTHFTGPSVADVCCTGLPGQPSIIFCPPASCKWQTHLIIHAPQGLASTWDRFAKVHTARSFFTFALRVVGDDEAFHQNTAIGCNIIRVTARENETPLSKNTVDSFAVIFEITHAHALNAEALRSSAPILR